MRQRLPVFPPQMLMPVRKITANHDHRYQKPMVRVKLVRYVVLVKDNLLVIHKFRLVSLGKIFLQLLPLHFPRHLPIVSIEVVIPIVPVPYQLLAQPQHLLSLYCIN